VVIGRVGGEGLRIAVGGDLVVDRGLAELGAAHGDGVARLFS